MRARVEIELLREQAAAGDMVLAYVDEAGFAQVHPNRSAWTPQGERHRAPPHRSHARQASERIGRHALHRWIVQRQAVADD